MSDIPECSSARMRGNPDANAERYSEDKDEPNDEVVRLEDLSEQEKLVAKQNFANYCSHVEFYNLLQHRATNKPSFLNRCLDYKIKAKRENRLPVTVSLSWNDDKTRSLFPLCICLTKDDPNDRSVKGELKYQAIQIVTFQGPSKLDGNGNTQVQAKFFIPKEANSCNYCALILASVENPISLSEVNSILMPWDFVANELRHGEICLYQEISFMGFYAHPNILSKKKIEIQYDDHLFPSILKYCFQGKRKWMSIEDFSSSQNEMDIKPLEISISTKKSKAVEKSYNYTHRSREVRSESSSLSRIPWLKENNVSFYYRYYNNKLQHREVTEDFCCIFCLVKFPSFKALKCHLTSSHDAFDFEFSTSGDLPSVFVSMKKSNSRLQINRDGVDSRLKDFFFCAKRLKRRELKNVSLGRENDTDQMLVDAETLTGDTELLENDDGSNEINFNPDQDYAPPISDHDHDHYAPPISDHDHETLEMSPIDQEGLSNAITLYPGTESVPTISDHDHDHGTFALPPVEQEEVSNEVVLYTDPDSVQPISEQEDMTPQVPQASKRRKKLPIEHHDLQMSDIASTSTENCPPKLKQREFYHSHTYQAMALEEVLLDEDSEDEINEYAEDVEEQMKFAKLGLSDLQQKFLFMWNKFIRKQRVLADAHMNWACEAFTKHHCAELAQSSELSWSWRLFMIKLWDHNLLDGRTFNQCSVILQEYRKQNSDISQRLEQIQV